MIRWLLLGLCVAVSPLLWGSGHKVLSIVSLINATLNYWSIRIARQEYQRFLVQELSRPNELTISLLDEEETLREAEALARHCVSDRVTTLHIVTSMVGVALFVFALSKVL